MSASVGNIRLRTQEKTLKKASRATAKQKTVPVDETGQARARALEDANKTASFVAHELNNLLTVIQINTEFLLESVGENAENADELDEIQRASKRASILARQLLASARLQPFDASLVETTLRKRSADKAGAPEKSPSLTGTILLVEDEAAVRSLARKILTQKGYRVLEASDGAIALRVAAGHVGEIDLVLTDVAMPVLGGRGLVEELRELSPGVRVLFMSGYPREEIFPDKKDETPYLQKPFTSDTLLSEVRSTLGIVR
ncbi:MAG TPA: response regulator [Gemmatimonadaceae bacterium]|nr:response regulator [Gemmatimonadaceae bacterium]